MGLRSTGPPLHLDTGLTPWFGTRAASLDVSWPSFLNGPHVRPLASSPCLKRGGPLNPHGKTTVGSLFTVVQLPDVVLVC